MSDWGNLVGQLWVSPVASNNRDFKLESPECPTQSKGHDICLGRDYCWGAGDLGFDLGESSGPVWVFPTRKRPQICDDADFDADATSVREPPPFHEYKCTWSSLVLNSSTQAHAVTLARFSFRVPSIRKQQESWVFFIGSVVWVGAPGADVISQGSGGSGWLRWGLFSVLRV